MIFVAGDIIQICIEQLASYSNGENEIPEKLSKILGEYYSKQEDKKKLLKIVATPAISYLNNQLYSKHKKAFEVIKMYYHQNTTSSSVLIHLSIINELSKLFSFARPEEEGKAVYAINKSVEYLKKVKPSIT